MARMIPSYISTDVKSSGEKEIFSYFEQDSETKDWVVLHSLNLSEHVSRRYGEIDFVVLAPNLGIFCLEIKAGGVSREDGVWYFINRFGRREKSPRSPYQQAREGMFSMKNAIKKKYGISHRLNRLLFDWGVMFPNVVMGEITDLEVASWQVYDKDSQRIPVSNYIRTLAKESLNKLKGKYNFTERQLLPSKEDIEQIVGFLRGDFEKFITPKEQLEETEKLILNFTNEQFECLDHLKDNNRLLIQGAAGTGKTLIAMESAKRELAQGKRILFVCYNNLLGHWLQSQFPRDTQEKGSYIGNFHSYLSSIVSKNINPDDKEEYFENTLPKSALEITKSQSFAKFDRLIIDEGQDLLKPNYLNVFDEVVNGGLKEGQWSIYCDFERQAIYADSSSEELIELLNKKANYARYRLYVNCRNTKQIGEEISLLCGLENESYLPNKLHGPSVEYYFYESNEEQKEKLNKLLSRLKTQKIQGSTITILSPYQYANSIVGKGLTSDYPFSKLDKSTLFSKDGNVMAATIHGFKGLENSFIILTDIEKLQAHEAKALLYVGMSRARIGLFIFANKKLEASFDSMVKEAIKRKLRDER
jgi:hypothetical protein